MSKAETDVEDLVKGGPI